MIVVDASVAVKWFLLEPGSDAALDVLSRVDDPLHGPDLLLVEVTSAIVRQTNQRIITREDASHATRRWMSAWGSGQVHAHQLSIPLISAATRIAIDLGHPLKDCIYLALALDLGCALLTADAKFRDRAVSRYPAVALLGSPPS